MLGLTGKKSISQCIKNIILTPKGSVPFRPDFGLGLENLLGGIADKMKIRKAIIEQIEEYEPRIEIKKILIDSIKITHYKIAIIYKIKDTGEESAVIINI